MGHSRIASRIRRAAPTCTRARAEPLRTRSRQRTRARWLSSPSLSGGAGIRAHPFERPSFKLHQAWLAGREHALPVPGAHLHAGPVLWSCVRSRIALPLTPARRPNHRCADAGTSSTRESQAPSPPPSACSPRSTIRCTRAESKTQRGARLSPTGRGLPARVTRAPPIPACRAQKFGIQQRPHWRAPNRDWTAHAAAKHVRASAVRGGDAADQPAQ